MTGGLCAAQNPLSSGTLSLEREKNGFNPVGRGYLSSWGRGCSFAGGRMREAGRRQDLPVSARRWKMIFNFGDGAFALYSDDKSGSRL